MTRKRSVILLSGGLDSAANLAWCVEQDEPVLALTFRYGQKAQDREVAAAQRLCRYYDVRHEVVELSWLGRLGGSSLTEAKSEIPRLAGAGLDDLKQATKTAKAVWVPNRNGVFINIASAFAERVDAEQVVVGFNREEAVTFPDNTVEFLNRASAALEYSTLKKVRAVSYTAELDKREMVQGLSKLAKLFPFDFVWSCYAGGEKPCGVCESCNRLKRALAAQN